MQYADKWDEILRHVQKPGRYIGGEWNEIKKDPCSVKTKVALAFPDLYEVGMSYIGQKILYHILNANDSILAERVFTPWIDCEKELRKNPSTMRSGMRMDRLPRDRDKKQMQRIEKTRTRPNLLPKWSENLPII